MRAGRDQGGIPQCLHDSNALTGFAVWQAIGIVALAIATVTASGQHPSVSSGPQHFGGGQKRELVALENAAPIPRR